MAKRRRKRNGEKKKALNLVGWRLVAVLPIRKEMQQWSTREKKKTEAGEQHGFRTVKNTKKQMHRR
jgi:hypothetical protein